MPRWGKTFPWQLYRQYLIGQFVISIPIFICLLMAQVGAVELAAIIILFMLVQSLWGLRVFAPLGRIIEEPLRRDEEPAEWFDLQQAFRSAQSKYSYQYDAKDVFEASLHALEDAVLIVDEQKNLKFWNRALAELSQQTNLKGLHLEEVFRDPDILNIYAQALSTGEIKRQNFPFRDRKNQTRYFLLTVVPLKRKSDGTIYGAIGIFNDITDIQKTEVMRMDFVANVSHELRTPLTSLKGYAQAIDSSGDTNGETKKYAQIISRNVDKLIYLVNDLLDLSYLESGISLNLENVDTKILTESVLVQLESARAQKQQTINLHIKATTVRGDPERLEQVLVNLVQNAIKYIPEKSKVDIEWDTVGNEILLKVRDNGPGIDEDHLPRIFERFYRADKARSPDKGGTGLGLAIVKHIVQRHGGSVSVSSHVGEGTEFICRFPC